MSKTLSVIVPTYNRAAQLQKLIAWLELQTIPRNVCDVILVNDGSTDETAAILKALPEDHWIKGLSQPNQGQAKARDLGVNAARGDILLFLDDDMEPASPGFLEAHLGFHRQSPAAVALGAIRPPRENPKRPAFELFYERSIDALYQGFRSGKLLPTGQHFFSANVSLPKALYHRVGGFDPSYRHAEDRELGLRLFYREQAPFVFLESASAFHHSPTGRYSSFMRRAFLYGRYDLRMAKSYPEHDELSPYQIFARPPISKMIVAKFAWNVPGLAGLLNTPLSALAQFLQLLGLKAFAIQTCSALFAINYVIGLREEHNYGS